MSLLSQVIKKVARSRRSDSGARAKEREKRGARFSSFACYIFATLSERLEQANKSVCRMHYLYTVAKQNNLKLTMEILILNLKYDCKYSLKKY